MENLFYSVIGMIAILVAILTNHEFVFRLGTRTEARHYRHFLWSVLFFYIVDVSWGIAYSNGTPESILIFTTLYFATMSGTVLFCCRYVSDFLRMNKTIGGIINLVGIVFLIVELVALVVNVFHPFVFWINAEGQYQSGVVRDILYIVQLFLFVLISLFALVYATKKKGMVEKRNITIYIFGMVMTAALAAQTFVPILPFYTFGLMVGLLVVHIFIHGEEKEAQMEKLNTLNQKYQADHEYLAELTTRQEKTVRMLEDYLNIISNAGLGVWYIFLKDGKAPRMRANDKMKSLLGIENEDLTEEQIYDAWYGRVTEEARPSVQASVQEMLDGKFSENTYKWDHPVKGIIYARCGGTASLAKDGTYVLTGYHGDVTDVVLQEKKHEEMLEHARAEAEAANAAKTSFLFSMSHDIRTPMNAIIGYSQLMKKHLDEREKMEDYLTKINDSSTILLSMINNVLEMARIEKGTLELTEAPSNTETFFDSIRTVFVDLIRQKGIQYHGEHSIQHHLIYCDVDKLRKIYLNIISNAIKYTNPGGTISIKVEELPSEREGYGLYRTTISDNGIGMSEEFLPHLFEEFSREKISIENRIEGTGLGMSIVKRLVALMEGTIEVQSKLGEGTTFIVTLPHRFAEMETSENTQIPEINHQEAEGKRVLLAEDNDLNAEIAIELLSEAGFSVERAMDGAEAVEKIEHNAPDYYSVVLMDIQMPRMNGYVATRTIRAMENTVRANIPIIAMTANAFEEDKRSCLRVGMNDHLAKPINVTEMLTAIARVLE